MTFDEIYKKLKPLKNKIHIDMAIKTFLYFLALAFAVSIIIILISLFIPVSFLGNKLFIFYITVFIIFVISLFIIKPKTEKLLKTADMLGFNERLITAYCLKNDVSAVAEAQRKDTYKALENTDLKKMYRLKPPLKPIITCAILLLVMIISFNIPSTARKNAREYEKVIEEIDKQVNSLSDEIKKVNENKAIKNEVLEKINQKANELIKEMKGAKSEEDALKALSKAKNALFDIEKAQGENFQSNLRDAIDKAKYQISKASGDNTVMFGQNQNNLQGLQDMENLASKDLNNLQNLDTEDLKTLQNFENIELQELNEFEINNMEKIEGVEIVDRTAGENPDDPDGYLVFKSNNAGAGGKEAGKGSVPYNEGVFVPEILGQDSDPSYVNGKIGNSGETLHSNVRGLFDQDIPKTPYSDVLPKYRDKAFESINEASIPSGMKDIVRDYFTSFE